MGPAEEEVWYPTVDDVLRIHEDIVEEDPNATRGVHDESRVEFALDYVRGHLGDAPETVHGKAFHLMRLIASNHWFADGNKRTALNATELFYLVNGYELDYGADIRAMLKLFSVREDLIDRETGPQYLRDRTRAIDVDEVDSLAVVAVPVLVLVAKYTGTDAEALIEEADVEPDSLREGFGLTTRYGTTVNIDEGEQSEEDGS